MKKHFVIMTASVLILIGSGRMTLAATYSGGNGSAGTPYLIATVADYKAIVATSADWNKYFKQTANLNFAAAGDVNSIGYYHNTLPSTPFTGTYDGNGYTISNISIGISGRDAESKFAMFGSTGSGAVIKNVTVKNATITGTSPRIGRLGFYAVLVGDNANGTLIENCNINGTINFTYTNSLIGFSGMIVGRNKGNIKGCTASGNITFAATGGSNLWVGGIAAHQSGAAALASMTDSTSTVSISCNSAVVAAKTYVGGIVGYVESTDLGGGNYNFNYISNCRFDGTINLNNTQNDKCMMVGGVVGRNHSILQRCSAKGTIIARSASTKALEGDIYPAIAVGGIAGGNSDRIYYCYSDCDISIGYATKGYMGGAIGINRYVGYGGSGRYVSDCYALGSLFDLNTNSTELHVPDGAGGFVGDGSYSVFSRLWSAPRLAFSTGSGYPIKGFAGVTTGGTFANCFWNKEASGITATDSTGITGKTKIQMMALSTFTSAGWDFVNTWRICEGLNYPQLKCHIPVGDYTCPDGVNAEDLGYLANHWLQSDYGLGGDPNLSGVVNVNGYAIFARHWLETDGDGTVDLAAYLPILSPLPKVHYSWGITEKLLNDRGNEIVYQLARITHSLCVAGEGVTSSMIDNCVYTCANINKTGPNIPCSIGINYSPWHRKFMSSLSNFPDTISDLESYHIFEDPSYQEEIDYFVGRMTLVKQWVSESNIKYGANVKVGAILLDTERFWRRGIIDQKWDDAMCGALDVIHQNTVALFPDARIEWYGRGMACTDGITFWRTLYYTGKEIMPTLSCSLYTLPNTEVMRQLFRKTCALADTNSIKEVTPWVALGSGYKTDPVKRLIWTWDWDYDLQNSYIMGAELNDFCLGTRPVGYPSYNRAKAVIFWPPPFDSQVPAWGKHFIAYCKGAASANK